jgi:hypothetical protein
VPAIRHSYGRLIPVEFGPKGAAKVLFALRPDARPPWDNAIREKHGYDGSRDSYREYLLSVRRSVRFLIEEASKLGIQPSDIPTYAGRPRSSLPKLIDEYNWVLITRAGKP